MPDPLVLATDRSGPTGGVPVVLVHAGVADRRMWDDAKPALTAEHDVVTVDLRGFGESTSAPGDGWSHATDLLATLAALDVGRAHLVGASLGAGVVVEVALTEPGLVASLLLVAPGGQLITEVSDDLRAFVAAEDAALDAGDLDAAAQANVDWWLVGPGRRAEEVPTQARELVFRMQRLAFEIDAAWTAAAGEPAEQAEPDPPVAERLGELTAPTLVLTGGLDLAAIGLAAERVEAAVTDVRREHWPDVAHLPSLERPAAFAALVADWVAAHA